MLGPLVILAILATIGGWIGWPEGLGGSNLFAHFLEPALSVTGAAPAGSKQLELILAIVSTLFALGGWFTAYVLYSAKPELPAKLAAQFRTLYSLLLNKYWVDQIYGAIVVTPLLLFSRYVLKVLIDTGVVDGAGYAAGYTAQGFGAIVQRVQSGNIRSYAGWLALGAAVLLVVSYFGLIR